MGRGLRLLSTVLFTITLSTAARAEGLMEAYRLAVQNDPRLAAVRFDYEASQQSTRGAVAGLLPSVIAAGESTRERQNIISSQNAVIGAGFSKFPIDQYSLTVTQPLFRLAAWERLSQAEAAEKQSLAQRVAGEQALMVRVASAYLGVLAAQDNLAFASSERVSIGQQLELAKERVARGLATVVNLHDAQSRFATSEAQEVDAKNTLDDANQAMREIIGKPLANYRVVRDEIPVSDPVPGDVTAWLDTALKQNPGLEAKRYAAEVALQEMRKQRAGYAPTLDLVGSYINRNQGGTLFGGGSHVETTDLSLKLNVPLYEGGMTTAATQEAVARHSKALEEVEAEQRAVDRQTRAAFLGVVGAISRTKALEKGVVAQVGALKAKQASYRAGLLTLIAVLDAERDLFFVRRDYAKARYDYLLNRLKLKQSTGSLADSDLEALDALLN